MQFPTNSIYNSCFLRLHGLQFQRTASLQEDSSTIMVLCRAAHLSQLLTSRSATSIKSLLTHWEDISWKSNLKLVPTMLSVYQPHMLTPTCMQTRMQTIRESSGYFLLTVLAPHTPAFLISIQMELILGEATTVVMVRCFLQHIIRSLKIRWMSIL